MDNTDVVIIIIEITETKLKLMAMMTDEIDMNLHQGLHLELIVELKGTRAGLHTDRQGMNLTERIALAKKITTLTVVVENLIVIVEAGAEALRDMNVKEIVTKEKNRLINRGGTLVVMKLSNEEKESVKEMSGDVQL